MSSPLVLGFNLSNTDQMDRVWPIITNTEAIAIDHAWDGSPGTLFTTLLNGSIEVWAKPLPSSQVAVLVLNPTDGNVSVTLDLAADVPGAPTGATMRDVWNHKDVPIVANQIELSLETHDSFMAVFSGRKP